LIPQRFLGDVAVRPGVDAHDAYLVGQPLLALGIVVADGRVDHAARHEVHALDFLALAQRPGQFDDVKRLAAGVGVASQFEVVAADQAMDADQQQVELRFCGSHRRVSS